MVISPAPTKSILSALADRAEQSVVRPLLHAVLLVAWELLPISERNLNHKF